MARKRTLPLQQTDLAEFLAQESDFGFEMETLATLRSIGLSAEHAAVYADPITGRLRAYDIRARWHGEGRSLRLAIECKHLRPNAPLLIHATPRLQTEAYHTVVVRKRTGLLFQTPRPSASVYAPGESVGRHTDQPSKEEGGDFRSSDAGTFDKWLQAVNGCRDLIKELLEAPTLVSEASVVIPVLVVPKETLWQVDYEESGSIRTQVRQVERSTLILRHVWSVPWGLGPLNYDVSHLEIVTLPALAQRVKNLVNEGGAFADAAAFIAAA